jgi:hypothetical protein
MPTKAPGGPLSEHTVGRHNVQALAHRVSIMGRSLQSGVRMETDRKRAGKRKNNAMFTCVNTPRRAQRDLTEQ